MHGLRRRRDQRARGEVALGHPRALVEQARGLVERLDIDLDDGCAEAGEPRERRLVGRSRCAVAEEQPLTGKRRADPHCRGHRAQRAEGARARIGIGGVGAGHHLKRGEGVIHGEREQRDAVERAAGGHDARGRNQPEARLEADDVAQPRRHAAGAGGVAAERERHQAGRHRDRRARARAARDERRIEQVARDAVGRAHADEAGRELVEVGLADDDGAGRSQARDAGGVLVRLVGKRRAGGGGGQASDVDIVLDRERDAVEWAVAGALRRQRLRFGDGLRFLAQRDEHGGVAVGADACVGARDGGFGAGRARTMRLDDGGYRLSHCRRPSQTRAVSKQHASRSRAMPAEVLPLARSSPAGLTRGSISFVRTSCEEDGWPDQARP
jgi:hypothetical protein